MISVDAPASFYLERLLTTRHREMWAFYVSECVDDEA
jgi:hypothetical protein